MRLPEDVKRKWLEALRSGKYTQGFGELNDGCEGLCCLGVLAEVLEPGSTTGNGELSGLCTLKSARYVTRGSIVSRNNLEALFHENPGLRAAAGKYAGIAYSADDYLMSMNDDARWGFAKIADAIEEHL